MKKVINYPEIGKIEICTRKNCNGIRYAVSEKYVRIYVAPRFVKNVLPIPADKVQWLLQHKEKFAKKAENNFLYNIDTKIDTFSFKLKFAIENKLVNQFSAKLQNGVLTIFTPPEIDLQNAKNQRIIINIFKHFLTKEAKRILPEKLNFFAEKYGFKFSETKITSAKSRWGSCNSKKCIVLSCFLMLLPENLIDMILIHELCHTEQMNHGEKFYARLRGILPNLNEMNKELKSEEKRVKNLCP